MLPGKTRGGTEWIFSVDSRFYPFFAPSVPTKATRVVAVITFFFRFFPRLEKKNRGTDLQRRSLGSAVGGFYAEWYRRLSPRTLVKVWDFSAHLKALLYFTGSNQQQALWKCQTGENITSW
jgi:hypothetical protein